MLLPPFPPYTAAGLASRFPGDQAAHQRILLLKQWLVDGTALAKLVAAGGGSRASLYRLRQRWEEGGIRELLSPLPRSTAPALSRTLLRQLLTMLRQQSSFALGCSTEAHGLLPHLADPAQRGQALSHALITTLRAVDAARKAEFQGLPLMEKYYCDNVPIAELARATAFSERHIYTFLAAGLDRMIEWLPPMLKHTPRMPWSVHLPQNELIGRATDQHMLTTHLTTQQLVRVLGLSGVGKSTLIASMMASWERAGWTVIWGRYDPTSTAPLGTLIAKIYAQCAAVGLLSSSHPDPQQTSADHLRTLLAALQRLPAVLVIDDVHTGATDTQWPSFLASLASLAAPTRLILIGQPYNEISCNDYVLSGLAEGPALEFYTQIHGPCPPTLWPAVYQRSQGNPQLLRMLPPRLAPTSNDPQPIQRVLGAHLQRLSASEQRHLAWLSWWEGALSRDHPFCQQAPGSTASLERLAQQQMIITTATHLTVHDLVRLHIKTLIDPMHWKAVRSAVQAYAERTHSWELAYRCAQDAANIAMQCRASRAAAQEAERVGNPTQALRWWNYYCQAAAQSNDSSLLIDARLAEVECLLNLQQEQESLARLQACTPLQTPEQHWRAALYRLEIERLAGNYAAAQALRQQPPLSEPAPASIDALRIWRLQIEQIMIDWYQEREQEAWDNYCQLGPPPPPAPPLLQKRFYKVGVYLSLSRSLYTIGVSYAQRLQRVAQVINSPFIAAEAQILRGYIYYGGQRYRQAERTLSTVLANLDAGWVQLRRQAARFQSLTCYHLGNLRSALHWSAIARQASQELGWAAADPWWVEGMVALAIGEVAQADAFFRHEWEADSLSLHDRAALAGWRVLVALQQGNGEQAMELLATLTTIVQQHDLRDISPFMHFLAGKIHSFQGDIVSAAQQYHQASLTFLGQRHLISQAEALAELALCQLQLRHTAEALASSSEACTLIATQPTGLWIGPNVWQAHAQILAAHGDHASDAAWRKTLAHIRVQMRQLPASASCLTFLQRPALRPLLVHFHGIEAVQDQLARTTIHIS